MKTKLLAVAIGVTTSAVAAMPVGAHPGHGTCAAFGATVSGNAQSERPWGQIVAGGAQAGLTSALTEEAHTTEGLCDPRP